jgi:hypothetical protein
VYIDLVDTAEEEEARRRLLAGVDQSGARPTSAPFQARPPVGRVRLGQSGFPGRVPRSATCRHATATSRAVVSCWEQLHASLQAESAAAVLPTGAVHGLETQPMRASTTLHPRLTFR